MANIFSTLLRRQTGNHSPTVEYLLHNTQIIDALLMSYNNYDIALNAGFILRECIKYEPLCYAILHSPLYWSLFDVAASTHFEVSTDSFSVISESLQAHQNLSSEFLVENKNKIFEKMNTLLNVNNYVTQRQSLKLIATMIRKRSNYSFMTSYVSNVNNLKIIMMLLRNKSQNMRYDAFQIFKIFVANPKKHPSITEILLRNRSKLIDYLKNLDFPEKKDTDAFLDEKKFIIAQLTALSPSQLQPLQQQQQQQQFPVSMTQPNSPTIQFGQLHMNPNTSSSVSLNELGSNSNGGNGNTASSNGSNSRLRPQLMGAVGSAQALTPVVQTDQVMHFPSTATSAVSSGSGSNSNNSNNSNGISLNGTPITSPISMPSSAGSNLDGSQQFPFPVATPLPFLGNGNNNSGNSAAISNSARSRSHSHPQQNRQQQAPQLHMHSNSNSSIPQMPRLDTQQM